MTEEQKAILSFGAGAALDTPEVCCARAGDVLGGLMVGNRVYTAGERNPAPLTDAIRIRTAEEGQHPRAALVCCADSRVPAEHIFSAGLGELFVIRNAGNLMGPFDIGSAEYAAAHLHVPLIVVLGHRGCGAVASALAGGGGEGGCLDQVVAEVAGAVQGAADAAEAEERNLLHSLSKLRDSAILRRLHEAGQLEFAAGIYDIRTGLVRFLR